MNTENKPCDMCGKNMKVKCSCEECRNERTFCSKDCAINYVMSCITNNNWDVKGKERIH